MVRTSPPRPSGTRRKRGHSTCIACACLGDRVGDWTAVGIRLGVAARYYELWVAGGWHARGFVALSCRTDTGLAYTNNTGARRNVVEESCRLMRLSQVVKHRARRHGRPAI